MAWGLFKDNFWRVKTAGMGAVSGVNLDRATGKLVGAGVDIELAGDLLAACERGFVAAVNEKDDGEQS
jgi:hypothetical protein